jgi:hypothetical protein
MEITAPNTIKLQSEESIFKLIKIIKDGKKLKFLEGPIWKTNERPYSGKLATRTYHLVNHYFYVVRKNHDAREEKMYLRVSGRGNVHEITYDKARDIICKRTGFVDSSELMKLKPSADPAIPNGGDW